MTKIEKKYAKFFEMMGYYRNNLSNEPIWDI